MHNKSIDPAELTMHDRQALRHCTDAIMRSTSGIDIGFVIGASMGFAKALVGGGHMPVARLYINELAMRHLVRKGYLRIVGQCRGSRGGLHNVYQANVEHPFWLDPYGKLDKLAASGE